MANMQTDVEVLKSEVRALNDTLAGVGAKMDLVLQMQLQMVQLSERQEHQRQALDRAFDAIRETKNIAYEAKSNIGKMLSFVRGGALIGAALFSFVQWYTYTRLEQLDSTQQSVAAIDRRIMHMESKLWPDTGGRK